jgi:hypothetical protein
LQWAAITVISLSKKGFDDRSSSKRALVGLGAAAFCLLALLNCGGYRYGFGDQAFYVPAVVQHLDASLFARDRALLHVQDRFMAYDDIAAAVIRTTGISLPVLFVIAYFAGMVLLFGAAVAIGRTMYQSWWTVAMLAALLTLRHRITQTGANSLEAYFQPRMLACALGLWAIASYLRGRGTWALAFIAAAFLMHPTTGVWFGIWVTTALAISEREWRVPLIGLTSLAVAALLWMVALGPLRGHLATMDPRWASVLAGKDYIFPFDWTVLFWIVNLGYAAVVVTIFQFRRRRGIALPRETGLVAGALALVCLFLISVPLMRGWVALALQLQTSRVFWMLDLLTTVYVAWLLAEGVSPRLRRGVVLAVIAIAVSRGVYVTLAEHRGGRFVSVNLPNDNWTDAMRWLSHTPPDSHVLADPGHAWKYGTSVRVAGERDVYLEEVKDAALALYSREVAMRVLERIQDAHDFGAITPERAQALTTKYDLNYLVLDHDIALPMVYRNSQFRIYALGAPARFKQ